MIVITICLFIYSAHPWGNNNAYQKLTSYFILAGFLIWSILPYITLIYIVHPLRNQNRSLIIAAVGIVAITIFGIYLLIDSLFTHKDPQSGLIFFVLPFYQIVAALILLLVCSLFKQQDLTDN